MDLERPEEQPEQEPSQDVNESPEESGTPQVDSARDEAAAQEEQPAESIQDETKDETPAAEAESDKVPAEEGAQVTESPAVDSVPETAPAQEPETDESVQEEARKPGPESQPEPVSSSSSDEDEPSVGEVPGEGSGEAAWYVIHCYSGYENKVRHNLEQRIETMGMKDRIFDVVIPTQEEIEVRDGKRRTVERHIFPGYVLVNMALSEESWYVVRNTPGVTGFVGMGNLPTPLRPEEVSQIIKRMEAEAPTVKVTFKVGERVRIIDGPFNDFRGTVSEIDMERTKVRVMVSFFGRETPVELDFLQVEKA